jgi:hypothetical protein
MCGFATGVLAFCAHGAETLAGERATSQLKVFFGA